MAENVTLGKADEIADGEVRAYDGKGEPIAVANVGGTYYAFDDTCTHRQCSLAEGELEDTTITCACHGSEFDVRTGEVLSPPARDPVKAYPTKVEDGQIQIER